jgi:bleomycin hydrolase
MMKNAKPVTSEMLEKFKKDFNENPVNVVLQNAASKAAISDLVYVPSSKVGRDHLFSIDIKTLPVANQKASGRCWIFAGLNTLREIVAKKCNLQKFELSQNYTAFYDKLEKINYALESVIDVLDKDPDERYFSTILHTAVGDGGQWDMFKSLVKKYGVVPKNVMDETFQSSATRESDWLINTQIRNFAAKAKKLHDAGKDDEVQALKLATLEDLYRVITISFGQPVEKFNFEYVDKDGTYHLDRDLTPKTFFDKYIGVEIDDLVSIVNAPTKDKPYYDTFTVDYVGNVIGGDDILYLNLPMEELKELVIKQLKDGEVVWFGSDCGKFASRAGGMWAPEQFDYKTSFGLDLDYTKEDGLDFGQSAMNHAMVITGVNLIDDKPTKWKIENSWGSEVAYQGYYTASDLWFDRFVYQAVVNKKYLNNKQLEALKKEPKHLSPWDPMGTLAK